MKDFSLEAQLGYFVGEYIYHRCLPTLSTDSLQTRKVIQVSSEDAAENKRLEQEWFNTCYGIKDDLPSLEKSERWKAYHEHNKMLEEKYMPHTLKCYVPQLSIDTMNLDEFKKGLITSLWDTDLCAYSLKAENIAIYNTDDSYFTIIELKLGVIVNDY